MHFQLKIDGKTSWKCMSFYRKNDMRHAKPAENACLSIERHAGCPWGLDRLSSPGTRDEERIWYAAREIRLLVSHRRRDACSILFWSVCLQHFTAQAGFSTANFFTTQQKKMPPQMATPSGSTKQQKTSSGAVSPSAPEVPAQEPAATSSKNSRPWFWIL